MATEAQIAANRRNAQKSTGPRTPEGKEIASRNALKYATLARNLLVSSRASEETSAEFQALCDEYYKDLAPVGPIEEMLVDQIVKGVWRMRRADQAEAAEITLSMEAVAKDTLKETWDKDHVPRVLQFAALNPDSDILELLVVKNEGCEYVLHLLNEGRQMFQRDNSVSPRICDALVSVFRDSATALTDPLSQMTEEANSPSGQPGARELREKHHREIMAFFDDKISYCNQLMAGRQTQTGVEAQARQKAAILPSPQTLYKILRYGSTQERQIIRAMDLLRKHQSHRKANANN